VRSIRNLEAGRTGRPRAGTVRLLADAFELSGADRDRFSRSALDDTDQPQAGEGSDHRRGSGLLAGSADDPHRL
jgi:hypothetical protein